MKGKVNQRYQNFFIQFRLDFRDNMAQSDSSIKILTSQVQEDGKLKRVIEAYVEEGGRDLICITKFDGQQEFFWLQCPHSLQLSPHYCKEVQKIREKRLKRLHFIALAVKKVKAIILREIF